MIVMIMVVAMVTVIVVVMAAGNTQADPNSTQDLGLHRGALHFVAERLQGVAALDHTDPLGTAGVLQQVVADDIANRRSLFQAVGRAVGGKLEPTRDARILRGNLVPLAVVEVAANGIRSVRLDRSAERTAAARLETATTLLMAAAVAASAAATEPAETASVDRTDCATGTYGNRENRREMFFA